MVIFSLTTFIYAQNQATISPYSTKSNELYSPASARNHHINIQAFFFTGAIGDLVYASLYKTPVMGGAKLSYHYQNSFIRHGFLIKGGAGRIFSPYLNGPENLYPDYAPLDDLSLQGNIRYFLAFTVANTTVPYNSKPINKKQEVFSYSLGLGLGAHFYFNAWIPDEMDVLRYTWTAHTGVGLEVYQNLEFTKTQKLEIVLYLPVIGAGWRPTYNTYTLREETLLETGGILAAIFTNPSLLAWHNFASLSLELNYRYQFTDLLSFLISYQGRLEFISIPRIRLDLQNNFAIGIGFNF